MRTPAVTLALTIVAAGVCGPAGAAPPPSWRDRTQPYRAAVLAAAKANRERPKKEQLRGDALADHLLQAAAARLRSRIADLDPAVRAQRHKRRDELRAFCVAMGVAMDPTGMLTRNPMARFALGEVETAKELAERKKALGEPTVRGRGDWCRHLWVSAGLRALLGRAIAENVGLAKEFSDARRLTDSGKGEGFALGDLCADVAGIELAERLLAGGTKVDQLVARLAEKGRHADWMPDGKKLPSGLDAAAAAEKYGHAGDPRMRKALADLRLSVLGTPGQQAAAADAKTEQKKG